MKRLLKILFVFVLAWFASIGVKAQIQDPVLFGDAVLYVSADKLELKVNPNVSFTQENGQATVEQTTDLEIIANGNWELSVKADGSDFISTTSVKDKFPVSNVKLKGSFIQGIFSQAPLTKIGTNGTKGSITWHLDDLGNIYTGTYSVGVTFTLSRKN